MAETIYMHDLLRAAYLLGFTNEQVAAKLGVTLDTFGREVARVSNGERVSVSPTSIKACAAAAAIIEEAHRVVGGVQQLERQTGQTGKKGNDKRHGLEASAASASIADPGRGVSEQDVEPAEHVASSRAYRRAGDAEKVDADCRASADSRATGAEHRSNGNCNSDPSAENGGGVVGPDGVDDHGKQYFDFDAAALISAAISLAGHPDIDVQARAIIDEAACADMDPVEDAHLVDALSESWKTGKRGIKKLLEAARAAHFASQRPTAEEQAARAAAEAQAAADERQRREKALWASVSQLALDSQLLDRLLLYAMEAGVVAEESAIVAILLVSTSRLLVGRALCLLRRGAPASGKNYATDAILKLTPPEALVHLNSGSAKALQYYGGEDENALVAKILYVPEAAGLARRGGDEPEIVTMLRSLISEGEINYLTVVTREDGQSPITLNMKKKGPTALIMTSARDDVEEEMLTRLMMADSDETPATTNRVVSDLHKRATGYRPPAKSNTTAATWLDFQRWLELGAPYDVVIPFAEALRAAYATTPAPLRIRRDAGNIIGAVKAAAIVHRAQRQLDSETRIIATLADYEAVYRAFAPGLAALYRPRAAKNIIAVIAALERIKAVHDATWQAKLDKLAADYPGAPLPFDHRPLNSVQATYRQLAKELGVNSIDTVGTRVRGALTEEVIEVVDVGPVGRATPRWYRIKVGSAALGSQTGSAAVLPSPAAVQAMIDDPQAVADAFANFDAEVKANDMADTEADAALFREMFGEDP